jgi:PBSX family phage terminase large subunit
MTTATQLTPDSRTYRGANADAIRSRDAEIIVSGPAGTGKTLAVLHKLHRCAIKYPGMRALIARKTRISLNESALVSFEHKLLDEDWYSQIAAGLQKRTRQSYRYPNGSTIVLGGFDNVSRMMSTEYDLIYVNEAREISEDEWEQAMSRLRNHRMPYQQMIGDTNPDAPTHWIKQRANNGQLRLLESRHEDNPEYHDGKSWTGSGVQYLARLARLTGVRLLRLLKGLWVGAEGQIYDEWDDAVHVIDDPDFTIPASWTRFRGIDFGYTNPFVCQWWAADPDGRLYLYRELYGVSRLVTDWAAEIDRANQGDRIEWTVADWDAEGRATLNDCGIDTIHAVKDVKDGIECVQRRLRLAGDGKPRVFILRNAIVERDPRLIEAKKPTCTIEEMPGYVWAPPLPNRAPKEEPRKIDDHGCDTMRYVVAQVDGLGVYVDTIGAW